MKLIGPFAQLLTMRSLPLKGALRDEQLEIIADAGILVQEGMVVEVGVFEQLRSQAETVEEVTGSTVALPGFVDSHTHICFGGSRARDYALRNSGATYLEIAKAGGGIWDTVTQTRLSTQEELTAGIEKRAARHLASGITTIEVKSGYGLSVEEELKMLRAIAGASTTADLVPTCLAAHIFPKDYDGSVSDYLAEMAAKLFPVIKAEGLAARADAFIEEEAYTPEVIAPYFEAARELGFDITVHADQFSPGGSAVATQFGAVSADHLEASGAAEIDLLAKSDVIATALPGATLGLGCPFTPARALLDADAGLAIASDWNPGSAPMGDLLSQAAILGTFQKLSNAEVLAGITFRAAAALRMNDRGVFATGSKADIVSFPGGDYREILYQQGQLHPDKVWKSGNLA